MKKLLLTLVIGAVGYTASAQQNFPVSGNDAESVVRIKSEARLTMPEEQPLSKAKKDKDISAWYNYNDALSSWYAGITGFAPFLAPDTFIQYRSWSNGVPTTWERVGWNSVGCGFDPSDPLYDTDSDPLTEAFPRGSAYTVDSISIPYLYYVTRPNEVDTLVIQLWAGDGMKGNGAEAWSYTSGTETVKFTTVQFDINTGLGKGAFKTIKIPLTVADTSTETFADLQKAIPGGFTVPAGNLMVAAMTFIPGYNYQNGDTIVSPFTMDSAYHNSFRFLMTSDDGKNNTGYYNNGIVVQYEQRHKANWLQSTPETSRYLSGTVFNSYLYPNIYYKVSTKVTNPLAPASLTATPKNHADILLSWTDNATNELGYRVMRSTQSSTGGFNKVADLGVNVKTYTDKPVADTTTYYYKVVAFNNSGEAESNVVEVKSLVGIEDIDGGISAFSAYPNPANETLTLQIGLRNADNLNIVISDITGKTINSSNMKLNSGDQNIKLDISNLNTGVYFATVKTSTGSRILKFMVAE